MRPCRQRGATLVELMAVMVLIGILSAVGMSRFASRDPFIVQGLADQLTSSLRLAQATAMAQRKTLYLTLGASPAAMSVCGDAACTQPLTAPWGAVWLDAASDLQLSTNASFSFAADGSVSLASALDLRVLNSDSSVRSSIVRVEALSGHVHKP